MRRHPHRNTKLVEKGELMFNIFKYALQANLRIHILPIQNTSKVHVFVYDDTDNTSASCILSINETDEENENTIIQNKFNQLITQLAHKKADTYSQKYFTAKMREFEKFWRNE